MINFKKPYKITLLPTLKEHWYQVEDGKKTLGIFPSSTTILKSYPLSDYLVRWRADRGNDESDKVLDAAATRGTNVHNAAEMLIKGHELNKELYTLDEWNRINSFVNWYRENTPKNVLGLEVPLFSKKYGYTGRADIICEMNDGIYIGDYKTSASMYNQYPLQFSSYANALEEMSDLKVTGTFGLLLGASNKNGYRYVIYPDWKKDFKTFLSVKQTWAYENKVDKDFVPPILNLPPTLKL